MNWGLRLGANGATARLWAPSASSVRLMLADGRALPMAKTPDGWHAAAVSGIAEGDRYRFEIDGVPVPDPASLRQPDGPAGWSEAARLDRYRWRCVAWAGRPWCETVLYELHIGTFSPEGTFIGAIAHLDHLVALGVTMIELMPVATFPGSRNWGYDGVLLFAPDPGYGTPEELQRLVDECHLRGLSIVLDVVYNHFGPRDTFLADYAPEFFTERHHTPWGAAVNFDGERSAAVRAFYAENAVQWVRDYRFDGLRLDAVQAVVDTSDRHILTELSAHVRESVRGRPVHLMLENDFNEARWLEPGGGYDAQWNDDFHHVMRVLVAGQTDGYYVDYASDPIQYLGLALTEGFAYQGQESKHRPGMFRGTKSGHLPPVAFVNFLQNHDQVGNAPYGKRLSELAPIEAVRLGAAVMLLSPGIPMLFMGEEWAASTRFDYFCDYAGELAEMVRKGRKDEFRRFDAFQSEEALAKLSDPIDPDTMAHSALDWSELTASGHAEALALHRELLRIRREAVLPLLDGMEGHAGTFTALSDRAIEVRWRAGEQELIVAANFSAEPVAYVAPAGRTVFVLGAVEADRLAGWGFRAALA